MTKEISKNCHMLPFCQIKMMPTLFKTYRHILIWLVNKFTCDGISTKFVYIITVAIAENIGRIKHWQIQLFRLFRGEKFGEWPNNGK